MEQVHKFSIKTMVLTLKYYVYVIIPLIKLWKLRKRKIHIAHHHMPYGIYAYSLPHACWKSPKRVWNFLTVRTRSWCQSESLNESMTWTYWQGEFHNCICGAVVVCCPRWRYAPNSPKWSTSTVREIKKSRVQQLLWYHHM